MYLFIFGGPFVESSGTKMSANADLITLETYVQLENVELFKIFMKFKGYCFWICGGIPEHTVKLVLLKKCPYMIGVYF